MAIRNGMLNLIIRLRALCNVSASDYTVNNITYWTEQQLQDTLDAYGTFVKESPLDWASQNISASTVYLNAFAQWKDWEEPASGTARWVVRTSNGTDVSTANYTLYPRTGQVTFTSDQGGTAYCVTGYSYDVYGAAVEVLQQKLAYMDLWYDFKADNQTFTRSQAVKNIQDKIKLYEAEAGKNRPNTGGGIRTAAFVRTDLS